jgi:cytochrome oxidase Cu insertion factor (SCO1/SenC/PrrC family)
MAQSEAFARVICAGVMVPYPSLCHLRHICRGDGCKENYTVDHSGNLVVLGPDGTQRGFIRSPLNNQKLKDQLPGLVAPKS